MSRATPIPLILTAILITTLASQPSLGMDTSSLRYAQVQQNIRDVDEVEEEPFAHDSATISDPIEPVNRFMFAFNDRFYFYILKPVAQAYRFILPESVRICVSNVFSNLLTPIRLANCLLQGKFDDASNEFERFCLNSTYGVLGLFDPAEKYWGIKLKKEDFGQTLGRYGVGSGFYIVWPILGPSSFRDSIGDVADLFVNPIYYYTTNWYEFAAVEGARIVNYTSLHIGEYEDIKRESLDPYLTIRDAYAQYRKGLVEK